MKRIFLIVIISSLLFSSCSNDSLQLEEDAEWVYYNQEIIDDQSIEYDCEYQIRVDDSIVLVKPNCFQICDVVNSKGMAIDTAIYDSIPFQNNMTLLGHSINYLKDYYIEHFDYSRITRLNYISKPIKYQIRLPGDRGGPSMEHFIEYTLDDKEYSIVLDTDYKSSQIIYNICQYDATRFIISMKMESKDRKFKTGHYGNYCVVMIDFEELSRKRFLGIKL